MSLIQNEKIRNIAIIAHVDHGKTTLVDQLFKQAGTFSTHRGMPEQDRVMDSMDLERERGITIAAKNCSIRYGGVKINILDTPGHADFGGEVERALKMVDGVVLLVDASEGPLPQTRFVLQKALAMDLKVVLCINKIDRQDARAPEVLDEIYNLFIDLGATDTQIDFPVLYAIGREGIAKKTLDGDEKDLKVLYDAILDHLPAPTYDTEEPFQMLVSNLAYSDYTGRLAIGRVFHGAVRKNDQLMCMADGSQNPLRVSKLQVYDGVSVVEADLVEAGDIVVLSGIEKVKIGDTICHTEAPKAMPRLKVDDPTIAMRFMGNTSPLSGKEGQWVQTQRVFERLKKEELYNVAIQVGEFKSDHFVVKGRGEFQLAVIIETMRREGFELCVGRPQILFRKVDGVRKEPIEHLIIDCEERFTGVITEKLALRKGRMINMQPFGVGRVRLEFELPSRGLIGYRSEFLTDTKGTGLMSSYVAKYDDYRGDIQSRISGSLVSDRAGTAIPYAIYNLEDRGRMFVQPGDPVYEGMIIGEHNRDNDLDLNITREKKLTNMRASGKDDAVTLTPVRPMTLEQAIEFIKDDEWVEVTPKSVRLRKSVLQINERKVASKRDVVEMEE